MQKRIIRMVVTDLDGTLLDPNRTISDRAVEMVQKLREKGVLFTFITGRPPYAVERFIQRVGLTAPVVCCNGAVIAQQGRILLEQSFSLAPLLSLMERASALGLTVLLYSGGVEYTLAPTDWTRSREQNGKAFPIWNARAHPNAIAEKVNIMADGHESEFAALIPEIHTLRQTHCVALYGNVGCEIVALSVNKATGLTALCNLCGVEPAQTLAIGDNENDHPMLCAAGIGAAVANATEATKALADYCCTEAYTDGVIETVDQFVLGETMQ